MRPIYSIAGPVLSADRWPVVKLEQNQVWQQGDEYLRVVHLERLAVQYKAIRNLLSGEGEHHQVTKKEFCRLIKGATLLSQSQVREIWLQEGAAPKAGDAAP